MAQLYERPALSEAAQQHAAQLAWQLTIHKSAADIRKVIAGLLCENQRLTQEVNEHRAARGYELLPTVEQ